MEYKGEITKENEQYVREIEARDDFNNATGHLPNGWFRKQYKNMRDSCGRKRANELFSDSLELWRELFGYVRSDRELDGIAKEIVRLDNETKKGVSYGRSYARGEISEEEFKERSQMLEKLGKRKHELFIPFYIHLRKQGFSEQEITA